MCLLFCEPDGLENERAREREIAKMIRALNGRDEQASSAPWRERERDGG